MERIVGTFTARDTMGNEIEVQVVRGFHRPVSTCDPATLAPDILLELRTGDGRHVSRIDQGTYEIIDGMETTRIWSDDPQAP
jgi:hypothetical protein